MGSYQKFIILSMPRSGTNYLSYLLHDHPQVVSLGELYDKRVIWSTPAKPWLEGKSYLKLFRDFFPVLFLKLFAYSKYPRSVIAVGFRFFYWHAELYPSVLRYLLDQSDIRIIHLKRQNMLENLVSLKIALETNIWISLKQKTEPRVKLKISHHECVEYFTYTEKSWETYDKVFSGFSIIDVFYEDLCKNQQEELKRILSFLGVSYRRLTCPLKKQNTRRLRDVILNYDELKTQFRHTKWKNFFD